MNTENLRLRGLSIGLLAASAALMSEGASASVSVAGETAAKDETLDEDQIRERKYFPPAQLQEGGNYLGQLMAGAAKDIQFHFNFDEKNPTFSDGYGLLIQPMLERGVKGSKMKLIGYVAAQVPSLEMVVSDPAGSGFVQNALMEVFGRKLKGTISSAEPGEVVRLPTDLAGFIERITRSEGVATFNALAPGFVKALKEAKFKNMSKDTLRSVLMSASFAKALYEKIPQTVWVGLLDKMAEKAKASVPSMDGSIFEAWKNTRDERSFADIEEVDLSSLGLSI